MGLLSWVGQRIGLGDGKFWSAYYGGGTWAGRPVNDVTALNVAAWWRCVRLYADVTGAMPLKMYRRGKDNEREQVSDHPVILLLNNPNSDQTIQDLLSNLAASMAVYGNSYAEKRMLGDTVVALDPLPTDTCPERRGSAVRYRYNEDGRTIYLDPSRVVHVRGFTMGRMIEGMSPLAAARQSLAITLATEEAAGKTFSQGLRASGFFVGPRLNDETRRQFTQTFIDPIVGNDAQNHYGILEAGFDFKPLNIPPKDAEMLLSRHFNIEEVCRFMGVPPILVGHASQGQTMWGTGVEAIINTWMVLGLDAFLRYFEMALMRSLLTVQERTRYFLEFERNALMRIDSAARSTYLANSIQNALMTPNEGRKRNNDPPMEGGDQLLVNSTLVPLLSAERAAGPPPTSPPAAPPAEG